ncbi:MAG: hypothetical protein NUW37_02970 [Planctomycetes bacterium]|nr:hypothetical protein [Planctomycetota bacterium]
MAFESTQERKSMKSPLFRRFAFFALLSSASLFAGCRMPIRDQGDMISDRVVSQHDRVPMGEGRYVALGRGDTVSKIVREEYGEAAGQGVVEEVLKINRIDDASKLQVGQLIFLPADLAAKNVEAE